MDLGKNRRFIPFGRRPGETYEHGTLVETEDDGQFLQARPARRYPDGTVILHEPLPASEAQEVPEAVRLGLARDAIRALDRLAQAVEDHNRIVARNVAMDEANQAEHDAQIGAFQRAQERRRAGWQVLYKRVVAPVVERFLEQGGLETLQSILAGEDKGKPS